MLKNFWYYGVGILRRDKINNLISIKCSIILFFKKNTGRGRGENILEGVIRVGFLEKIVFKLSKS